MTNSTLYTYVHKYDKYPCFQVAANDRNNANGMLTIWADTLPNYDGRNCDFEVNETPISIVTEEDNKDIWNKVCKIERWD